MASHNNIHYTTSMFNNSIKALQSRMADQLKKMDELDPFIAEALEVYKTCLNNLNYATLVLNTHTQKMMELQDNYNEMAIELEESMNSFGTDNEDEDEDDDNHTEDEHDTFFDYWCTMVEPKQRKTRKDVLTPDEAVKAKKASKMHKLKPKKVSRDVTRNEDNKRKAKAMEKSSEAKRVKFEK